MVQVLEYYNQKKLGSKNNGTGIFVAVSRLDSQRQREICMIVERSFKIVFETSCTYCAVLLPPACHICIYSEGTVLDVHTRMFNPVLLRSHLG